MANASTRFRVVACDCGRSLQLTDPVTNKCKCGQFFNGFGQRLAPPSQWGEETGERFDAQGNYVGGGDDG